MNQRDRVRKEVLGKRDQISDIDRKEASRRICQAVIELPEFQKADTIAFYKAMRSEVDLQEAMERAWDEGKKVVLPRVISMEGMMDFYQIERETELFQGSCGAFEPPAAPEKKVSIGELHMVLVPGAVFDESGYRLGYGGGFYDRLFAKISPEVCRVGIAFDEQVTPTAYPEVHDQPVYMTITPTRMIKSALNA